MKIPFKVKPWSLQRLKKVTLFLYKNWNWRKVISMKLFLLLFSVIKIVKWRWEFLLNWHFKFLNPRLQNRSFFICNKQNNGCNKRVLPRVWPQILKDSLYWLLKKEIPVLICPILNYQIMDKEIVVFTSSLNSIEK